MAMNNTDEKYKVNGKASWDLAVYLNRQNPLPLDGTSVYNSLEAAQKYASENVKAYPGQIISVVTETEVKVYKINNGKLEELGKGSLVTDQNPKELATTDNVGQIIYLTKDVKVTEGSGEVTYSAGPYVVSGNLTTQVIDGEDTYSPGPYIVSGDGTVSKIGTTSASGDIAADVAALQGKVGTLESTVGKKGSGDNASTGLVKDVEDLTKKDTELADQITTLSGNVDKIKVEKVTQESESFAATYKFTDAAGHEVDINIPKDQFLKAVTYVADKPAEAEGNSATTEFPALKFEWQLSEQAVTYVSVKSLVDNYGIKEGETYLKKDESNNFYIDFDALKTAIIGSEDAADSVLGKIKAATDKATTAESTANDAKTTADDAAKTAAAASTAAGEAKTAAATAESTANTAKADAAEAKTTAGEAKTTAGEAKTAAEQAKASANANTTTLEGHTASINELIGKVNKNTSDIATNAGNITKNTDAITANTTAIKKNTDAIGTQAVVTPATIAEQFTGLTPDTNNTYFLADGAGKPVTVNDIKNDGVYYIYKKTYNSNPDDEQNVTISIVRQAEEGKDFTYPKTTNEATGLYQYIDNHIKNFDLSWQILD